MNEFQRTRQQQACHIKFKELQARGVLADGLKVYSLAAELFARPIDTLKALNDRELNALRDRLEGKHTKQQVNLYDLAKQSGIENLDRWIKRLADSETFAAWRGHTAETLPAGQQWRLTKMLERRVWDMRKANMHLRRAR